jgi:AcrR family transcriptional regulator
MEMDTRARLIDATWDQIRAGGVSAATSRAITNAAGANLGAITYYFGSKDALVAETLVGRIRALLEPALDTLAAEGVEPTNRLDRAATQLQTGLEASADDAPGYLEAILQSRHGGPLGAAVRRLLKGLRVALAAQIADLRVLGSVADWVEPDAMAGLLLATAQGVVLQTIADPAGPSHGAMASQFVQLLLASGTAKPAPSRARRSRATTTQDEKRRGGPR